VAKSGVATTADVETLIYALSDGQGSEEQQYVSTIQRFPELNAALAAAAGQVEKEAAVVAKALEGVETWSDRALATAESDAQAAARAATGSVQGWERHFQKALSVSDRARALARIATSKEAARIAYGAVSGMSDELAALVRKAGI
jgi:hypothetical protein